VRVRLLTFFLALVGVFLGDSLSLSLSLCLLLFFLPRCVWLSESVKIVLLDLMNLEGVSTPLQVRSDDRTLCLLLVFSHSDICLNTSFLFRYRYFI